MNNLTPFPGPSADMRSVCALGRPRAAHLSRIQPSMHLLFRFLRHRRRSVPDQSGFTLLELLVVIAILGLLIGLVAPAVLRQLGNARISVAHQSIERMSSILDMYKLDVGTYPSSEQGLDALVQKPSDVPSWNGPYLQGDKAPVDAWNHPYVYRSPSSRPNHDYDLCSQGPTGNATGDAMICNN